MLYLYLCSLLTKKIMRIFLIGYMGSGKSTVGKKLAAKLDFNFVDVDSFIEQEYKISINDFFKKYGEEKFRDIEHLALLEIIENDNLIISTGGGLPCFNNNMQIIKENGVSIYLKLNVNGLYSRLVNSKKKRPLIQGMAEDDLKKFIEKQLSEREQYYLQSDFIVEGINVDYKNLKAIIENKTKKL